MPGCTDPGFQCNFLNLLKKFLSSFTLKGMFTYPLWELTGGGRVLCDDVGVPGIWVRGYWQEWIGDGGASGVGLLGKKQLEVLPAQK
jgi:hypothetical protein